MNKVTKPIRSGPQQIGILCSEQINFQVHKRKHSLGGSRYKLHTNELFYLVQIKQQCCSQYVLSNCPTVPCEYEASACADLSEREIPRSTTGAHFGMMGHAWVHVFHSRWQLLNPPIENSQVSQGDMGALNEKIVHGVDHCNKIQTFGVDCRQHTSPQMPLNSLCWLLIVDFHIRTQAMGLSQ